MDAREIMLINKLR
jgi:hypothetical protein